MEPADVRFPRRRASFGDRFGDRLGQVLRQVADRPVGFLRWGDDAANIGLGSEPHHMRRHGVAILGKGVDRFLPGRQRLTSVGVDVAGAVPLRCPMDVDGGGFK